MPVFVNKSRNTFLITNYKVMYTTLYRQLDRQRNIIFLARVLLGRLGLDNVQCDLLARNPYDKLESFFQG